MKRITLVCGHYGSGKTNFALNLAVNAAKSGEKITLVDLDIVNPYFRTADYKDELEAAGVNVIAQNLEGTTLDAPALTARMFSIFEESMGRVIVDVGGDDAGAAALGRFSRTIAFRASSTSRAMICSASSTNSANLFQVPMRQSGCLGR